MSNIYTTSSSSEKTGPMVYFVGAGPGAPDLITVRGQRLLQNADVVLYAGSLVSPALLQHCHEHCQCHDSASMNLDEQVTLMSATALAGKMVVRLHTGDPAMYGAINEQMRLLSEHGVDIEIVAGVSSVFAAAAALGCELTSPEVSQSVILTRTPGRTPMPHGEDAAYFARSGATLVFFLSTGKIDELMHRLAQSGDENGGGLAPDTPAAVVYRASWPQERILRGTISTIARQVEEAGFGRQALIFVGQALAQRPTKSKLYDGTFSHGYRNALPREAFTGRCALYAFSQKGTDKAMEIASALQNPCVIYSQHSADHIETQEHVSLMPLEAGALSATVAQNWNNFDAHIFIGAAGIAVRAIAPLLESKAVDPAVLTCGESGAHIISLTSGHLGGANRLARRMARITGGQAVISTATDGRNLPAFDEVAALEKARVLNPHALRACNAALLSERPIEFYGPRALYDAHFALAHTIYKDTVLSEDALNALLDDAGETKNPCVIWHSATTAPSLYAPENSATFSALFALPHVLVIDAKAFVLGIGCRRDVDSAAMQERVQSFLAAHGLSAEHIACIASCDLKADEKAILDLAQNMDIPTEFHDTALLATIDVPTPSALVAQKIGSPSVCEAAALVSAGYPQTRRLFATKQSFGDMTLALARLPHAPLCPSDRSLGDSFGDAPHETKSRNPFEAMPQGGVVVVGLGSGHAGHITPEVADALAYCDTVAGYTPYVDFIRERIKNKNIIQNGMMGEMARCHDTLEAAAQGKKVCMVCSGDAGILAMAGLLFELRHDSRNGHDSKNESGTTANSTRASTNRALSFANVPITVLPGITAANIAAASLGAPLQNGFCLVSLSDLLVPTDEVRANLRAVAQSALPVTLYNPAGKKRRQLLSEALTLFAEARGNVLCATVRHAGREQESKWIGYLNDLVEADVDMSTLVLIGGPRTMLDGDIMFEARGYADKYAMADGKKMRKDLEDKD